MWPLRGSGKPDGKRSLGRPRSRWDDNSKIAFKEMLCRSGLVS